MKKTTRILSILLIAAMLLGLLALTASAAETVVAWKDTNNNGVIDSGEPTFTKMNTALAAGGTIKLNGDFYYGDSEEHYISMSSGTTILDLNGYTLVFRSLIETEIIVLSGTADLTITDSKTTGLVSCQSRHDVYLSDSAKLTIAGGTIKTTIAYTRYYLSIHKSGNAEFQIIGGKHYSVPTAYVPENHKVVIGDTDPRYTVSAIEMNEVVAWNDADNDGVIDSGEQVFSDMDTALAAGIDLKMNSDIFRDSRYYPPGSHTISSTITIDLNGYQIIGSGNAFQIDNGTLTIKDSVGTGVVQSQSEGFSAILISSGSSAGVVVESGTILGGILKYAYSNDPNTVVLKGGNYDFDPSRYIKDSTLAASQDMTGAWGIRTAAQNACTVTISGEYIYNGSAIKPVIVVKDSGNNTLTENVDYTVVLENNVNVGTATVTVAFINDYRGSITQNFTIGCDHAYSEHTSATNGNNESHSYTCTVCNQTGTEAHSFNQTGLCLCGAQAVVSVTMGSTTQYYMDMQDVVTAVKEATTRPYVKLLADITLTDALNFKKAPQGMELDFAGKTIYNPNGVVFMWGDTFTNDNGLLALRDTVGGGGVTSGRFDALELNNDAVIYGGTYKASMDDEYTQAAAVDVYRCSVAIYGGVFDSTDSAVAASSGTVLIYGGSFVNTTGTFDVRGTGSIQVYAAEFPNGIFKETKHGEYAVKLANVLAPDCYLKDAEGNLISTEGTVYAVNGACTVSAGADLAAAVVTVEETCAYNGLEQKPAVTVTIHGRTVDPANYTVTYTDNVAAGTATVTVTGKDPYSGSNSTTFEITKGSLQVATNPETTYEFGANYTDVVTGGKVVIVGNESTVITGTWTWVEAGNTALFTPDAQYEGMFEELTNVSVTHVVTAAAPVIEVITPSPSIMPGMAIRMGVMVKNPHNEELTDLPTDFRLTYKVGENGTPVTVDGLEFTLSADTVLGEEIYVTVENLAVEGKYVATTSVNTIELVVGQVDYSAQIEALEEQIAQLKDTHGADVTELENTLEELKASIKELGATDEDINETISGLMEDIRKLLERMTEAEEGLIEANELITQIQAAITQLQQADIKNAQDLQNAMEELTEAIAKAEEAAITADGQLKEQLTQMMNQANQVLEEKIKQVQQNLEATAEELREAIENGDLSVEAKVTALSEALEAAKTALSATDEANRQELLGAISSLRSSLQSSITAVANNLTKAKTELEAAINAKSEELNQKIDSLNLAIAAAKAAMDSADADLQEQITAAQTVLQAAIDQLTQALADTKAELEAAIANGDAALDTKVEMLNAALADAKAALEQADAANKAELEAAVDEAYAALNAAIEATRQELANAKAALEKADADNKAALEKALADAEAAMQAKDQQLQTFIIIVCVVAGLSLCGSTAFVVWFFLDRKKMK